MALVTSQLCGAEYHKRGHKLCSHSVDSQHFMEPEGSLPSLKSSPPVPILSQTNAVHNTESLSPKRSFLMLSIHVSVFLVVSFPLCVPFRNEFVFYGEGLLAHVQPPSWRTTPCRLSAAAYSIYSQLTSNWKPSLPSATRGRAMPW
jgi:hypothetical protein